MLMFTLKQVQKPDVDIWTESDRHQNEIMIDLAIIYCLAILDYKKNQSGNEV